eukprot:4293008-Amphidinium_carterae.1
MKIKLIPPNIRSRIGNLNITIYSGNCSEMPSLKRRSDFVIVFVRDCNLKSESTSSQIPAPPTCKPKGQQSLVGGWAYC